MRRLAVGRVAEQDGLAERADDPVPRGDPAPGLFYLVLNSSRPLFANASQGSRDISARSVDCCTERQFGGDGTKVTEKLKFGGLNNQY